MRDVKWARTNYTVLQLSTRSYDVEHHQRRKARSRYLQCCSDSNMEGSMLVCLLVLVFSREVARKRLLVIGRKQFLFSASVMTSTLQVNNSFSFPYDISTACSAWWPPGQLSSFHREASCVNIWPQVVARESSNARQNGWFSSTVSRSPREVQHSSGRS